MIKEKKKLVDQKIKIIKICCSVICEVFGRVIQGILTELKICCKILCECVIRTVFGHVIQGKH